MPMRRTYQLPILGRMALTNKEIKEKAQDELISGMQAAFSQLPDDAPRELRNMMSDQFARIEKLFGYEAYSNPRGV